MAKFQFKHKNYTEKTGLVSYLFENDGYLVTVYAFYDRDGKPEIQYPVTVKAKGVKINTAPDIQISSKEVTELILPPSILLEQIPELKEGLDQSPAMAEELKQLLQDIKNGNYK